MKGVNRMAAMAAIVAAGVLTVAQARSGNAMSGGLIDGSRAVAHKAERVAMAVSHKLGSFFGRSHDRDTGDTRSARDTHVEVDVRVRDTGAQQGAQQVGDFTWSGAVSTGESIEIKGVNGDVIAELADGSEIEVRAEKRARRNDPDEVRIEVIEHSDGVTVCAVYPSSRGEENSCEPGSGGRNNVRNNDVQVTFYVKVPAGVEFRGRTVNGDVEVNDLSSDVNAHTVNGDIEIATTGYAEANTVNGSIEAAMGSFDVQRGLSFSTVNGSITLDVPDDIDADVDAKWVNGSLEADLPLELVGRLSKHAARGALGEGGPELSLKTVNGSIHLH